MSWVHKERGDLNLGLLRAGYVGKSCSKIFGGTDPWLDLPFRWIAILKWACAITRSIRNYGVLGSRAFKFRLTQVVGS